jgi:hypothetical protein
MDPMISLLRSVVVVPSAFVKHNGLKSLDEAGVIADTSCVAQTSKYYFRLRAHVSCVNWPTDSPSNSQLAASTSLEQICRLRGFMHQNVTDLVAENLMQQHLFKLEASQ